MLFVVPNSHHIGAGALGVLEGVEHGCIYNWYEEIEPVIPRVYHKYLKRYNPFGSESIILSAEDGSADGKFVITINEELEEGNSYFYKFTDKYPQPGEDVSDWDVWDGSEEFTAENGTSICIVEADKEGKAVKAGMVVVVDETDDLDTLTVTSVAGTKVGFTKITVSPEIGEGNSYHYKETDAVPEVGSSVLEWTKWNGTDELEIATGTSICVVEADAEGNAVAAGITTVTAKEEEVPEPELGTLTLHSEEGTEEGYTKITVTEAKQEETNQYFYKEDGTIPDVGGSVLEWTAWNGTDEIQATNGATLAVVEATAEGNAVAGGTVTVVAKQEEVEPEPELILLNVSSAEGTNVGFTVITVNDNTLEGDNKYVYSATETLPTYNQDLSTWTAWNGTDEIEAATGTKICVAEVTSANLAVKAGVVTVTAKEEEIEPQLGSLTVTCAEGEQVGHTKITVEPTLTVGNKYYTKENGELPSTWHQDMTSGDWTEWNGTDEVQATDATPITVVETTAEGLAEKAGTGTTDVKPEPEPELGTLTLSAQDGTLMYSTKITVTEPKVEETDQYFYKAQEEKPVYGESVLEWTSWDGTSDIVVDHGTTLCIVEATQEGTAVAAGTVVADCRQNLSVVSEPSDTTVGNTKITITPEKTGDNVYFWKLAEQEEQVTLPNRGESVADWTSWDGSEELAISNGSVAMFAEASAEGIVYAAGQAVIQSKVE